ncbi:MAG: DNA replication/repair protein RecF [Christensenellales bacterium]|jgi:DNA replication and repair protein RecF
MRVTRLKLANYRNYEGLDLTPHPGLTLLFGDNAQGKTNALEAVYLCATGRSHRTTHDAELVLRGMEAAYIRADVLRGGFERRIEVRLMRNGRKQIRVDGAPIARMGDLMGCLNAVLFSPEELSLVKDGPNARRRFLDVLLCQTSRAYFYSLVSYQRALAQRNALLKESYHTGKAPHCQMEVWEEQLALHATALHTARKAAMEQIAPAAAAMHRTVAGGSEDLALRYKGDLYGRELKEALEAGREDDMRRKLTTRGPHRDDFSVLVDGVDLRAFGSQGQQRTAALSIKLAEAACMESMSGEKPVLLLDDVLSELDTGRQKRLMDAVSGYQTILTCAHLPKGVPANVRFKVQSGSIAPA